MIFVLGIERSATTWLSNILDMHTNTALYMEPLSENISLFKHWPDRFVNLEDLPSKARYFKDEFSSLKKRRKCLFTKVWDTSWAWDIDMKIAKKFWDWSTAARDFYEVNFHRSGTSGYPSKREDLLPIIKELRLNFNGLLINEIDPEAKVLVVLRNYAANIQSISKQFKNGSLKELQKLLRNKYGSTELTAVFDYWADSYNTLLHDLDDGDISYMVIEHENLMTSGSEEVVDELFEFIGLQSVPSVYEYLATSNKSGSGKHSTTRSHAEILEQNQKAERALFPKLAERIAATDWHPVLQDVVKKTNQ